MRRRRNPEVIAGRVNADGSIAAGDGFSCRKNGTGRYLLDFAPGFRVVAGTASALTVTSGLAAALVVNSGAQAEAWLVNGTNVQVDTAFSFVAVGAQT
jgi:hypothetical protein